MIKKLFAFALLLLPFSADCDEMALSNLKHSAALQARLESEISNLQVTDPNLRGANLRIALVHISNPNKLQFAHINGNSPVYPASVVKFVYLLAAFKWEEDGKLTITDELHRQIELMIGPSSNPATREVFGRITNTKPGPSLSGVAYNTFCKRRLLVKTWLESHGIFDLHTVHPTYDGDGDIFGRDAQFLRDTSIKGGLPRSDGTPANRQSMTALGTAKLLTLLARGALLSPENTQEAFKLMERDTTKQPYQIRRIAGGAERIGKNTITYSKSGTWGPIFADAGIVKLSKNRNVVIAIFVERNPPYRGTFVADLSERLLRSLYAQNF